MSKRKLNAYAGGLYGLGAFGGHGQRKDPQPSITLENCPSFIKTPLMNRRHKKKTTLITSNLGFSQWSSFLKNDHLTAALIDRLTENSHVVNMKNCVSLRPKLDPVT